MCLVTRQNGGKLLERRGGASSVQRSQHSHLGREVKRGRERIPGARVGRPGDRRNQRGWLKSLFAILLVGSGG